MTPEFDPRLQALFDQAEQPLDGDRFLADIMQGVDRQRRRAMLVWSLVGLIILVCLTFIASPVFAAVDLVSQFLPVSLVEIETEWLQMLLSPINSVAAAIAVGALLARKFYRWIFD